VLGTLEITVDFLGDAILLGTPPLVWMNKRKFNAWRTAWKIEAKYQAKVRGYSDVDFIEIDDPRWTMAEALLEYEHADAFECWRIAHETERLGW
jgi:hypothetical protein